MNHKNSKQHKKNLKELLDEVATSQEKELLQHYDSNKNVNISDISPEKIQEQEEENDE